MHDVNLIPHQRWQQKRCKSRLRRWASICAVYFASMALCLSSAYALWHQDEDTTDRLNQTINRVEKYSHTIVELKKLLAQTKGALSTTWAIRSQPNWSQLMTLLSEELGHEVVLNQCELLSVDEQGKPIYGSTEAGSTQLTADALLGERHYVLKLSGIGRHQNAVSQFVLRLEGLELFDSVRLDKSRSQIFMEEPAVSFTIECRF